MREQGSPVEVGEVLAGKYRVEQVLGVGGMGVVVSAIHLQLDEPVALKFLLPEALKNPEVVERFGREARAAAKIKSEHVARVIDVGQLPTGSPYLVMEYLDGEDLSRVVSRRGPLPVDEAVSYILQACDAIGEAHSRGIIHRDLKPSNLFLAKRPGESAVIKVLDFGISKIVQGIEEEGKLTQTQSVLGSPMYMPPEQMTSARSADARSDIWSLGAILYELLTGSTPFTGSTITELIVAVLNTPVEPPRTGRPEIPEGIDRLICRCLDKVRDQRFDDVGALAQALEEFAPADDRRRVARIVKLVGATNPGRASAMPASTMPVTLAPVEASQEAPTEVDRLAAVKQSGDTLHLGTPMPADLKAEMAAHKTVTGVAINTTLPPPQPRVPLAVFAVGGAFFGIGALVVVGMLALRGGSKPTAATAEPPVASASGPSAPPPEIAPRPSETVASPSASPESALPAAPRGAPHPSASARPSHGAPPGSVKPAASASAKPAASASAKPPNKLKMDMKD